MSDFLHAELIIYFNSKYKHLFLDIQLQSEMFWKQERVGKVADDVVTVADNCSGRLRMNNHEIFIYSSESN